MSVTPCVPTTSLEEVSVAAEEEQKPPQEGDSLPTISVGAWRDKWADENAEFIEKEDPITGLVKMFSDARIAGIHRIPFNPTMGRFVMAAVVKCAPWASWESWGPWHLFVNIKA